MHETPNPELGITNLDCMVEPELEQATHGQLVAVCDKTTRDQFGVFVSNNDVDVMVSVPANEIIQWAQWILDRAKEQPAATINNPLIHG